jgi:(p)ppGpp synthase/HD superfamily hydrolase
MNDIVRITSALNFAAQKHSGQKRKGEKQEPYINHVAEVSHLLAEATEGRDPDLVIAGLLHDTVEDCGVKADELATLFGTAVATLVSEVTDDKSLPKSERKHLQVAHAPHKSPRAKLLKIADKISNLRAIVASPPADWSAERKAEYFIWAQQVVAGCRGVNQVLEAWFDAAYQQGVDLGLVAGADHAPNR